MRILQRYLFKKYIAATFFFSLIITILFVMVYGLRLIKYIFQFGISIIDLFNLLSLLSINFLYMFMPLSFFLGVFIINYRLWQTRELVILKTSGFSNVKTAKPMLWLSGLLVVINFLVSAFLMPYTYTQYKNQSHIYKQLNTISLRENSFLTLNENLVIFTKKDVGKGKYEGIFINDKRQKGVDSIYVAKEGYIIPFEKGVRLSLKNGMQHLKKNGKLSVISFDNSVVDINYQIRNYFGKGKDVEEHYLHELYEKSDEKKYFVELFFRLTNGFLCLVFGMMAFLPFIKTELSRKFPLMPMINVFILVIILQVNHLIFHDYANHTQYYLILYVLNLILPILYFMKILYRVDRKV